MSNDADSDSKADLSLPEPVQRAINREPLDEVDGVDWDAYRSSINVVPPPGGCLFSIRPRRRDL